ncbi:alpha-L-glutamate ligase-like protein, partial [Klebsiella pneumoniae]|nr:alpha-L-glutamate ligase-like protein [Klebsiella pneumoniae]
IANDCGLTHRAHAVENRLAELKEKGIQETPEERVKFSQELFGHVPPHA